MVSFAPTSHFKTCRNAAGLRGRYHCLFQYYKKKSRTEIDIGKGSRHILQNKVHFRGCSRCTLTGFLIATFQFFENQAKNLLELTYYENIMEMVEKVRGFA